MTSPSAIPMPAPVLTHRRTDTPPALPLPVARRVLAEAALLGATGDALLRTSLTGLALPLWIALVALTFVALTRAAGRRVPREAAGWLGTAVLFAAGVAWRDAGMLDLAGIAVILGALLMAAIALHDRSAALHARRLRDLLWAALRVVGTVAAGLLPLALREAIAPGDAAAVGRRAGPLARAMALALVLLLVFGALLRSADPLFASLVALPEIDMGIVLSHIMLAGFFAWLVAGWTRAALSGRETPPVPAPPALTLGGIEITAALGSLNILFALYVLTQLGWFFGGEQFLHARTGLTAAAYAREGFFQMVMVVMLVVPLLLATRAMLADEPGLARRHTLLAMPLIALLGAMIVSAATRLRLYVHYYGLTTDRFYAMAFMAWLGMVLVWLAVTVLRERGNRFVAGVLVSGVVALAALFAASPDAIVARVNLARAASPSSDSTRTLDLPHLARLSGDAVPLVIGAVVASPPARAGSLARFGADRDRCEAARTLLRRWAPESDAAAAAREAGAWRRWNAGAASGLRAVREEARALRAAQRESCGVTRATIPLSPAARSPS